jgi:hypothetical protein
VSWTISIPHASRDEPLSLTASRARHLATDDDRAVARQIVFAGMLRGLRSAGDLLDELGAATPAERRGLLDAARAECGLEPIAAVEAGERVRQASSWARSAVTSGPQACHATGCPAIPTTPEGAWRTVNAKRWFCPDHVDQAQPGDMDPPPCPFRYSPSGAIVPNDPVDEAREAAAEASRASRQEAEDATRAVEATRLAESRRMRDEAHRSELPPHLRSLA